MAENIEAWLQKFKKSWVSKDIDTVLELFIEDVEYFETPFQRLEKEELRQEWRSIREQKDIGLEFEVFNSDESRHAVIYRFECVVDGESHRSEGVYLIELNSEGLCRSFRQYPVEK